MYDNATPGVGSTVVKAVAAFATALAIMVGGTLINDYSYPASQADTAQSAPHGGANGIRY